MKKNFILAAIIFFALASLSLVAAAQTLPAPPILWSDVMTFIKSLIMPFPGSGISLVDQQAMGRFLLVMVLTIVLYQPANKLVGGKSTLAFFLSLLVSILGIRFLTSEEMIIGLMLPYGALAVVVTSVIPFMLFAILLETSNASPLMRKLGWGFMAAAFLGLWITRWQDIGAISYIYLIFAVIAAIILFFDQSVHSLFVLQRLQKPAKRTAYVNISRVQKEMDKLMEEMTNAKTKEARDSIAGEMGNLRDNLKDLSKML